MPGAVIRLPFEASGFAPSTQSSCVWSTSGIGIETAVPNMHAAETCFGCWSVVPALKKFFVCSAPASAPL